MFNYLQKPLFCLMISTYCLIVIFCSEVLSMETTGLKDESKPAGRNMVINHNLKNPDAGDWKDQSGRPAPPNVRRAADDLWTAVQEEEDAAWKDGWCVLEDGDWSCARVTCCILTCYTKECCDVKMVNPKYNTFARHDWFGHNEITKVKYENAQKNTTSKLTFFKDTINNSVLKPESYSGDAKICNIDGWVKDPDNFARNDLHFTYRYARRDTSTILKSTMSFVTEHGGWAEKIDPFSAVNAKMVGDTIYMGM